MTLNVRQPEVWRQLDRLEFRARVQEGQLLLAGPPELLPAALQAQVRHCRQDLIADVADRDQLRAELERHVRAATSWLDLEIAIAIASEAHRAAALSAWQVIDLTEMAIVVARRIPPTPPRAPASDGAIGLFADRRQRANEAAQLRQQLQANVELDAELAEEEAMAAAAASPGDDGRPPAHVTPDGALAIHRTAAQMPVATTLGLAPAKGQ